MTAWLVQLWLVTALSLLLVLAARVPVARWCGAGPAYALWLLPLLQPLLLAVARLGGPIPSVLPGAVVILPGTAGAAAPSPLSSGPGQWVPVLLALWAGGAAVFLLFQLRAYRRLAARVGDRPYVPEPFFGGIRVIETPAAEGPLALGFVRRRIAVPGDFLGRYSPAERRLALSHELVHHRRGDLWWNAAALVLLALNWPNPLAWVAFRAFRADQELACDAAVVAARSLPSERHDYARALVKSASRPGLIGACPLNSADQLKRRLRMMKEHRKSFARSLAGGLAVAALIAGGATLTPAAAEEGAKTQKKVVRFIERNGEPRQVTELDPKDHPRNCDGQRAESDIGTDGPQQDRIKVFVCERDGKATPAQMNAKLAEALQRARQDVEKGDLAGADKAAMLAKIDAEIARLRGQ